MNDIHFPFEDRTAYQIAVNLLKSVNISHLYLNGDIGEFQGVSTHPVHPTEKAGFCHEIDYINKKFDELSNTFPDIPITLIEGNHCYRFFRYIRDIAPHMWGLIDCPLILKFDERPLWKFVPYCPTQLVKCGVSNLYLRHEPLGKGTGHAKQTAESSYIDIGYGHTHTFDVYSHRKFGPNPIANTAYSLGWLGDKSRHCFDYRGSKDRWVKGCTIVECEESTGMYTLEFINLERLPVLYRGSLYKATN